jgi:hypothetical protein
MARRKSRDAFAPQLHDVSHLVHPDQDDYPDGEPDGEQQRISSYANEHGQRSAQELDLEKEKRQALELGEQEPYSGERRDPALDNAPQAAFRPQGLIPGFWSRPFEVAAEDGLSCLAA